MAILLGKYDFEGPYLDPDDVQELPGLIAVMLQIGGEFELQELVESANLKESIHHILGQSSDKGIVSAAVYYIEDQSHQARCLLRKEIMEEYSDADELEDIHSLFEAEVAATIS